MVGETCFPWTADCCFDAAVFKGDTWLPAVTPPRGGIVDNGQLGPTTETALHSDVQTYSHVLRGHTGVGQ